MTSPRRPTAASGTPPRLSGELGRLDPATGETRHIPLGERSAPHGVIVGPDGAPWITDGGLNAIVRVDPATEQVRPLPLPADRAGRQPQHSGLRQARRAVVHRPEPASTARLIPQPARSRSSTRRAAAGPTASLPRPMARSTYASLAGSHIARIDPETGQATPIDPPTAGQGARRVWSTRAAASGSASGTPASWASTTRRATPGANGSCRASDRRPTPSSWTTATSSG